MALRCSTLLDGSRFNLRVPRVWGLRCFPEGQRRSKVPSSCAVTWSRSLSEPPPRAGEPGPFQRRRSLLQRCIYLSAARTHYRLEALDCRFGIPGPGLVGPGRESKGKGVLWENDLAATSVLPFFCLNSGGSSLTVPNLGIWLGSVRGLFSPPPPLPFTFHLALHQSGPWRRTPVVPALWGFGAG